MNIFNEIAAEEAMWLREAGIATEVLSVSCDITACQETLRRAMDLPPMQKRGQKNEHNA